MEDNQLSFEDVLFEHERQLLILTSELTPLFNNLHYCRTIIASAMGTTKSKRHNTYLRYTREAITGALEWLAEIRYLVHNELSDISQVEPKDKRWFLDRASSDVAVEMSNTTPLAIYNNYISIYRKATTVFNDNGSHLSEITGAKKLIKEFYVDMQLAGENIEEIL